MLAVLTWSTRDVDPGLIEPALHLLDPDSGRTRDLGPAAAAASSLVWWSAGDGWHLAYLAKTPPALVGGLAVAFASRIRSEKLAVQEAGARSEESYAV
jgi:hypothetical protein